MKNFQTRVLRCQAKLYEYQKKLESSSLYAAALILHPNRRTKYLQKMWPEERYESAVWQVKKLWEQFRRDAPPAPSSYDVVVEEEIQEEELDEFDKALAQINEQLRPQSQDQYEAYLSESYGGVVKDPIAWWLHEDQVKRWPLLTRFAINILIIPAMSDKPEVVFSGGRRTMSWERSRLSAEMLEITECLKDWKKSNILNED